MSDEVKIYKIESLEYNATQTYVKFEVDGVCYYGVRKKKGNKYDRPVAGIKANPFSKQVLANKNGQIDLGILKQILEGSPNYQEGIIVEHAEGCKPPPQEFIKSVRNAWVEEMASRFNKFCSDSTD